MASPILEETLTTIAAERPDKFDRSFALVDQLLAEYGEVDLADRLVAEITAESPWELIADLLNILLWSTGDNGSAILRAAERWLCEGDEPRRVQIALNLECYPFRDRDEMVRVLDHLATAHPAVAGRCQELVASRSPARKPSGSPWGWIGRLLMGRKA